MNAKTIEYAIKQLKVIEHDNDHVTFHAHRQSNGDRQIYVEFRCGKNVTISDDEVYYQAKEYLLNEIKSLKHS